MVYQVSSLFLDTTIVPVYIPALKHRGLDGKIDKLAGYAFIIAYLMNSCKNLYNISQKCYDSNYGKV